MRIIKYIICLFIIYTFSMPEALSETQWDDDIERTYEVSDFNRIYIEGGFKVILEESDTPGLRIKADEETFEHIDVESTRFSSQLKIVKKHFDLEGVILYISFVELDEIHIEGGVKLETKGYLDLDNLSIYVEGGAIIEMEIKANEIHLNGEGGVYFDLKGIANSLNAKISGAGHLDAEKLESQNVIFRIEGVGSGIVFATKTLDASIEGVGKIRYKGNPEVKKNVEGIGIISDE